MAGVGVSADPAAGPAAVPGFATAPDPGPGDVVVAAAGEIPGVESVPGVEAVRSVESVPGVEPVRSV